MPVMQFDHAMLAAMRAVEDFRCAKGEVVSSVWSKVPHELHNLHPIMAESLA